ncbi:MFS transporter [Iamia sp. SCSIO 61187]|uniref:MFS transporter n=1 Tax=Iamia sp. SCSIO 61187 TaxID=2722752 RepID=UPI001C629388|nr:MFS transporter [Iamia sp. SCSIO 61187]QYG94559.1 MFS transporter [Iamia sp. SCSIO 61187]
MVEDGVTSDDEPALRTTRSPRVILTVLLLGLFSVNVTVTILAVSIPRISDDLGASQSTLTWVVSGPILAFGIIGPAVGKLGDLWGQRRVFLIGLAGASISAAASAVAWSAGSLIAFRIIAAAQGAATGPASFALIALVFPRSQRVKALGWWSMVAAGGPVIGVVVGGPLVSTLGWRAIFAGQVPLVLAAAAVAARVLPETPRRAATRFDWGGALLLALAATPVLLALNLAPGRGWSDPLVVGCFLLAPLAAVLFLRHEGRVESPLLPPRYLKRRNFALPILMLGLMNATYMGSFVLTPLLLQNVLGFDETKTGLISTARPLAFAIAGPLAAMAVARLGERVAGMAGASAIVASMLWMATIRAGTPALVIIGGLALAGVAMGISNPAMSSTISHAVDEADLGIAGAAQQMIVQVGVTFGIQLMQTVQQVREGPAGLEGSYSQAYLAAAVLAALCVVASAGVRRSPRRAPEVHEDPMEVDAELHGVPVPTTSTLTD